jgi:hypothetical protein
MNFCDMIFYFIIGIIIISHYKDTDEQGMDSWDRYFGIAGDGRSRSQITGLVYDHNGYFDFSNEFKPTNPFWDI